MSCQTCCITNIAIADDMLSVLEFFAQQDFVFVVNCPPGYTCQGGFPSQQSINHTVIPPIIYPQTGTTMQLQGCQSLISLPVPSGATPAQLQSIANQIFSLWAQQQAVCNAVTNLPQIPPPPARTGSSINKTPACCPGVPFSDNLTWPSHSGPFIMSVSSGTLPSGMVFAQSTDTTTGFLSGTPTASGVYNFTITITDGNGDTLSVFYVFSVLGISNLSSLPPAMENTAYNVQLIGVGVGPFTFVLISGNPPGITMSSSGLLSGTPNYVTAGSYPLTIQITDAAGHTCTQSGTLKVTLRPGPDWTKLVWSSYVFNHTGSSTVTGVAIQNITAGQLNRVGADNCWISPVAAAGVTYSGPSVTSRIILTIASNTGCGVFDPKANFAARIFQDGVQIGGDPNHPCVDGTYTAGVYTLDFTVSATAGSVFTIDDASPGNKWAQLSNTVPGNLSFTWAIVNV